MSEFNLSADLFAIGFFAIGGVALGISMLAGRPHFGLGLSGLFLIGAAVAKFERQPFGYWLPPTVLAISYLVLAFARSFRSQVQAFLEAKRVHALIIFVIGPLLAIGWTQRILSGSDIPKEDAVAVVSNAPDPKPTGFVAHTDKGREIPLFYLPADTVPEEIKRNLDGLLNSGMQFQLIQTASPDTRSNCHGWIFTGNRHHILGEYVNLILEDNDYAAVSHPQPNDLIVYFDQSGSIVHTGLVRESEPDQVVIESKWGPTGRYLHFPGAQVYSQHWTYYRSPRPGHEIRMDGSGAMSLH